jgi:hypothetical protein
MHQQNIISGDYELISGDYAKLGNLSNEWLIYFTHW